MGPKGVARGNQHRPEKEMAMYGTASLIVIPQEHLCDRKDIQSLVNVSKEQSCWKGGHLVRSMYSQCLVPFLENFQLFFFY